MRTDLHTRRVAAAGNAGTGFDPRRLGSATFLAVAVTVAVTFLFGCTPAQVEAYEWVNAQRVAAGAAPLLPSPHAMDKAQRWADHLAGNGTLAHSDLREGMPEGFTVLGENVGRGPDLGTIGTALLQSSAHRANLLDPRYDWVGVGVASDPFGGVYLVQVFARYR